MTELYAALRAHAHGDRYAGAELLQQRRVFPVLVGSAGGFLCGCACGCACGPWEAWPSHRVVLVATTLPPSEPQSEAVYFEGWDDVGEGVRDQAGGERSARLPTIILGKILVQ